MRFLLMMYPGVAADERWAPKAEEVAAMTAYNEELTRAGVLLALDGLAPPSTAAHVKEAGGTKAVVDGPFAEAEEAVGGYWVIQAGSQAEAVEWAKRCPLGEGPSVEVRRVLDMSDFPEDVRAAAELSQEPPSQPVER